MPVFHVQASIKVSLYFQHTEQKCHLIMHFSCPTCYSEVRCSAELWHSCGGGLHLVVKLHLSGPVSLALG